jgi:hypothetical protein
MKDKIGWLGRNVKALYHGTETPLKDARAGKAIVYGTVPGARGRSRKN